jgi:hypothetical protein
MLHMADGKEYQVPHPDYISLPPKASYVIVYDDHGRFTVLPLLTMTGLQSSGADAGSRKERHESSTQIPASKRPTLGCPGWTSLDA